LIDTLARDCDKALAAVAAARAKVRAAAWKAAGGHAPDHGVGPDKPLIVDLDATLLTAHSEKENAAPTFKRGYGFHPLCSFVDHGARGTGEPLAMMLRPGNAGSNTAADHITVTREALRQLPFTAKGGRVRHKVLIRTDAAQLVTHLERGAPLALPGGWGSTMIGGGVPDTVRRLPVSTGDE
jgi:hypothetical protein